MVEAGVLAEDEPVELLDGRLVVMTPQGPPHSATITRLQARLHDAYGDRFLVRTQLPLDAGEHDLPEPDLAIVRPDETAYMTRHPTGRDAVLVVEVALTSQAVDRAKARLYARAGVAVYWLLDLEARRLEVRTDPAHDGYEVTTVLAPNRSVDLPESHEQWTVASLLP